jgi:membrane protein DedA with SNARE-associated domain
MLIPLPDILIILEKYKYWLIFPIVIIEGPIIVVISGFLVYLGFLNAYITYIILVIGDSIGDSMYYAIGRYGGNIT